MIYRIAASLIAGTFSAAAFQTSSQHHFRSKVGGILAITNNNNNNNNNNVRRINTMLATKGPAYCEMCGTATRITIPPGDERERSVCSDAECGHVHYQNPKVVVGAVCTYKDRVLLCQRAIEPCSGKWGYPQGFMELGETSRQGAARETWEEAGVKFDPAKAELLAIYNLAGMQVQMIYRAELESDDFERGHESSDVKFVGWDEIVWDDLAFPTVAWGLEYARDMKNEANPVVMEKTKIMTMDGQWSVEEG